MAKPPDPRRLALIPLRGGSKGIVGKNIRPMAGRPLCAWVLDAACKSGLFDRVVVSTDCDEIAAVVRGLGLPVDVLMRPEALATDSASTESVMLHAAEHYAFDVMCLLQATSPLTAPDDLVASWRRFAEERLDSMVTGTRTHRFFWRDGAPLNYDPSHRPRRQDFDGVVMENGAFYWVRRGLLLKSECRLGGNIGVFEMHPDTAHEVDDLDDWNVVERLLAKRTADAAARLDTIELVVLDVDGTLTDGTMDYGPSGEVGKRFSTRDGHGIGMLRSAGYRVVWMTGERSPVVEARAAKLGVQDLYQGVKDKGACIEDVARCHGLPLSAIAMVGDDVNDLPAMERAGFSACPADAVDRVRAQADYVCGANGGHGAVREVAEHLLRVNEAVRARDRVGDRTALRAAAADGASASARSGSATANKHAA